MINRKARAVFLVRPEGNNFKVVYTVLYPNTEGFEYSKVINTDVCVCPSLFHAMSIQEAMNLTKV